MNSYTPHVWRVRVWIRLLALGNALIWGWLGAAVLFEVMPMGEDPVRGWVLLATLLVIPLYFAWRPYLALTADGRLRIRGWFRSRTSDASHVTSMYMNSYGLCFEFVDAKPFTCVVFQATAYRTYPRFFDAVEAITGTRPTLDGYTPFNLGPQLRPETMPTTPRFDNGPVKYLADIVSNNRDWVIAGEYRRALDRMRGLLREHPLDLELRAATAQLYRELGNPDEAGRWGFTNTSPTPVSALAAKLIACSPSAASPSMARRRR